MNYNNIILTILIFLVVLSLILFIYNKKSTYSPDIFIKDDVVNTKKYNNKTEKMSEIAPSAENDYNTYSNIPYKIYQDSTPLNMPQYGDIPQYRSTGCPDIRGRPAPLIKMLASAESTKNPMSIEKSPHSLLGTLYSSYGLCNQDMAKDAIHNVSIKNNVPNKIFHETNKHKYTKSTLANKKNRNIINKHKANILFKHVYGTGHYK